MAFSRTWNAPYEASPADTDQAKQGALRIREIKEDVRERAEVDHFWQDDTHGGKHKQVRMRELASDPANAADEGVLYVKDDGGGRTELYYIDSAGAVVKITAAGAVSPSGKVQVSANDTTPNYLKDKLVGTEISITETNDGGDEEITLAIAPGAVSEAKIAAAAISQGKLKTTTGDVSAISTSFANAILPGGQYGFYPQVRTSDAADGPVNSQISHAYASTSFATVIALGSSPFGRTTFGRQRYIQASPPYESYRAGDPVPLFIFVCLDKSTGEITATYVAEDPPWANNGPTIVNPLGRLQTLARTRQPERMTLEQEIDFWAEFDAWMHDPKNLPTILKEMNRELTQEEKNRDMPLIPHPFEIDPAAHQVVVLSPTDCKVARALHARMLYGGDSISDMLHNGYFEIDNTPVPGLNTPFNVMAVNCRLKNTARR